MGGERIDPKLRCKKCNGRKVNRERKILEVSVDKGMADSQKITFTGEGDQEPGMEPGDIIIALDDRTLVIQTVPGEVIKTGDLKCVYGEGMPTYKNPFEKGKLIVQFKVDFPDSLPPETAE